MDLKNIDIQERMKFYNITGLSMAFIENGQISHTECYGFLEEGTARKVNSDSVFSACSISKFLTSILVLKLTEQGILDLDEDVNNKLISWKVLQSEFAKKHKVTLRRLLCHQSGIVDPEDSFCELQSLDQVPTMVTLLEGKTPYCKEPIQVKYEPESDFQYSDAGFCVIQQLIEDVTGKSFETVMEEQIFRPLRMNGSTFLIPEENNDTYSSGHNKNGGLVDGKRPIYPYPAASGLWSTPSDLALLVVETINSLKGESQIGLSTKIVKEMLSAQGCREWAGLGVFLDGTGKDLEMSSLGWGVGFQCMMAAYPYKDTGLVIMTNTDTGVHQLKGVIGEIYHSIVF